MGRRKVTVKQTAADNIAAIAWFIEAKGLIKTANKFADDVYDYFTTISDNKDLTRFAENLNVHYWLQVHKLQKEIYCCVY